MHVSGPYAHTWKEATPYHKRVAVLKRPTGEWSIVHGIASLTLCPHRARANTASRKTPTLTCAVPPAASRPCWSSAAWGSVFPWATSQQSSPHHAPLAVTTTAIKASTWPWCQCVVGKRGDEGLCQCTRRLWFAGGQVSRMMLLQQVQNIHSRSSRQLWRRMLNAHREKCKSEKSVTPAEELLHGEASARLRAAALPTDPTVTAPPVVRTARPQLGVALRAVSLSGGPQIRAQGTSTSGSKPSGRQST